MTIQYLVLCGHDNQPRNAGTKSLLLGLLRLLAGIAVFLFFQLNAISEVIAVDDALDSESEQAQHHAIEQIAELGGNCRYDHEYNIWAISFTGPRFGDEHLRLLVAFDPLGVLYFIGTKVTTDGLNALPEMLSTSRLSAIQIKDSPELRLPTTLVSSCPILHSISAEATATVDSDLKCITECKKLQFLHLRRSYVSDEGLQYASNLSELESIWLSESKVVGPGLDYLADLPKLNDLLLKNSRVTDDGLRYVGRLKHLKYLDLRNLSISGTGLQHLSELNSLETLLVEGTKVDAEGLGALQELASLQEVKLGPNFFSTREEFAIWWDILVHMPAKQQLLLDSVMQLGATVTHDIELDMGFTHAQFDESFSDADIEGLKDWYGPRGVTTWSFRGTELTDEGVGRFCEIADYWIKDVPRFDLRDSKITTAGARRLQAAAPRAIILHESIKEKKRPGYESGEL